MRAARKITSCPTPVKGRAPLADGCSYGVGIRGSNRSILGRNKLDLAPQEF